MLSEKRLSLEISIVLNQNKNQKKELFEFFQCPTFFFFLGGGGGGLIHKDVERTSSSKCLQIWLFCVFFQPFSYMHGFQILKCMKFHTLTLPYQYSTAIDDQKSEIFLCKKADFHVRDVTYMQ